MKIVQNHQHIKIKPDILSKITMSPIILKKEERFKVRFFQQCTKRHQEEPLV